VGTRSFHAAGRTVQIYDADGRRVEKATGTTLEDYLYDKDGNLISNWITNSPSYAEYYANGWHFMTGYVNGAHTTSTEYFQHSDWLGTERMRTDINGNIFETCTSLPFGDGLNCAGPTDVSPLHFTGKERDSESGLDNFGARYNSSQMGRFMSPDWSASPEPVPYAKLDDPQSLNLFAYARNNPVTHTDPDGHCWSGFQSFCNFVNWGHWVDNAHLDAALQKAADQARADIARTKNMTFNGKSPQDYAAGLNNQQAILAQRALVNVLAGMAMANLASPCGNSHVSCGVVLPLGLGSTGRAVAADLREQLAMEEVMADPKGTKLPLQMNDQRWPGSQGWVKMSQTVNGVEIHWVENTITGAVDDFKFIK
jgi:RHS repeat-associated protein